jgi:hypothetical protein
MEGAAEGRSLREIARELNRIGVKTPRGKDWYASSVSNQLATLPQRQTPQQHKAFGAG